MTKGRVTNLCNCDNNDAVQRSDVGYITNKVIVIVIDSGLLAITDTLYLQTALPVMAFQYGHMHAMQNASVTVGPLECQGTYTPDPSSCEAKQFQGLHSGYYIMDKPKNASGTDTSDDVTKERYIDRNHKCK